MYSIELLLCFEIFYSCTANLFSTPPNNVTLSVMTITDASDEVFVAGGNKIYKLSANLSQLMNVTVSNNTSVSVRGLSLSNGGQYIMACLTTGSCIGYDVIDLNRTISSVPLNKPGTHDNPVVMFPGQTEGTVYAGTSTATDLQFHCMNLGQYRISGGSILANTTRGYAQRISSNFQNIRIFKAGFTVDDFTYYIVEDDGADIRILRVCNEPAFQALYELELVCASFQTTVFAGASILNIFFNSTDTLLLTVRSPDTARGHSGVVCTYNISDINTAMDNGLTACAAGENRATVWDDSFPLFSTTACTNANVSHLSTHTVMLCSLCL